jgi:hypothetical protein
MLLVYIGDLTLFMNNLKNINFSEKLVCTSLQQCGYLYSQLHVSSQHGVTPPPDGPLLPGGQAVQQVLRGLVNNPSPTRSSNSTSGRVTSPNLVERVHCKENPIYVVLF